MFRSGTLGPRAASPAPILTLAWVILDAVLPSFLPSGMTAKKRQDYRLTYPGACAILRANTTEGKVSVKAIGYVRVSTQGQAEDGVSLDAQEAKVRAWADLNGAEVFIFRDEGISGKRADNRPGLVAALDAVGKGDALVCYSMSRLSRSIRDTLNLSEHLQHRGADLVSLSEHIDTCLLYTSPSPRD